MAKKFLDVFGEAFEEDILDEVIPNPQKNPSSKRRKKRFMPSLNEAHSPSKEKKTKKKSLLDTMEEALDNQVFDQLFPDAKNRPKISDKEAQRVIESPFSTMITTEVLDRARAIAQQKGLRVKDVINKALEIYVEQEWEKLDS